MMIARTPVLSVCLVALLGVSHAAKAQLVVDNTITPTDLVQNVLLGGGVNVSNVTFNGVVGTVANIQVGSFNGANTTLGMTSGLLLSSGDINVAVGPNDDGGATEGTPGGPGDPDLEDLVGGGVNTNDAAVLEFDFVPDGDSLSFSYIFGSEEYLEWVNAGFNDVFGFFLSGPGISGPFSNNAINIALIPGTSDPVSIDNVNPGLNPQYYVDNGDGFTAPCNTDPMCVQFDGITTVLTANAVVQCGQTYHIKLAIADAGDAILDSGVFIEAGSFSSPNSIQLEVVTASADGTLTEGCTDAIFTISRPGDQDSLEVTVSVSGSATNGVDYTSIPTVITIPQGQDSVSFTVEAFEDGISEGLEEIVLTALFVNACGDTSISVATVTIVEYVPIALSTQNLQLTCDQEEVPIQAIASGGFGDLSYLWSTGENTAGILVTGLANGVYDVSVTDECEKEVNATVTVDAGCEIVIPNVFSPNGDGLNDFFVIEGISGVPNEVRIFNRWGAQVFETKNYGNNWGARDLSDGTYFYEVIIEGKPDPYTGHLTILSVR